MLASRSISYASMSSTVSSNMGKGTPERAAAMLTSSFVGISSGLKVRKATYRPGALTEIKKHRMRNILPKELTMKFCE